MDNRRNGEKNKEKRTINGIDTDRWIIRVFFYIYFALVLIRSDIQYFMLQRNREYELAMNEECF